MIEILRYATIDLMSESLRFAGRAIVITLVRFVIRLALTIAGAGLLVFMLLEVSLPGGYRAVVLPNGDNGSPRSRAVMEAFHLDDNVIIRWFHWLGDLVRGDLGVSNSGGDSVIEIINHRLPISAEIMILGVTLTILIGLPLGLFAVLRADKPSGKVIEVIIALSQSIPVYVTPLFLVAFFSVQQRWLPASGWIRISDSLVNNLKHLILPMAALVFSQIGEVARIVRSDVTRVMKSDFIAAAIGKGLSQPYILFRHALRPASLSLINVLALNVGALLTGAIVIELVFGFGGLGLTLFESTINRDLYTLLGVTAYAATVHVVLHTIFDELLAWLDPQIEAGAIGLRRR